MSGLYPHPFIACKLALAAPNDQQPSGSTLVAATLVPAT
jgi:hypothetical protein